MMMSNAHMMANDIDWFCIVDNHYPLHLASNGSIIPTFAAERDELAQLQQQVANLPEISNNELRKNQTYIDQLSHLEGYNESRYLQSFRFFAGKGFYSFDYEWANDNEGQYILLVAPQNPISPEVLRNIPHINIKNTDDRYSMMFRDIIQQIRNLE
jgi:hypothetical protein